MPCGSDAGGAGRPAAGTVGNTGGRNGGGDPLRAGPGAGTRTTSGRRSTTRLEWSRPPRATVRLDESSPRADAALDAEEGEPLSSIPSKALCSEIEIPWSPIPPSPGSRARAGTERPSQRRQTKAASSTLPEERSAERTLPERAGLRRRRMFRAIEVLPPQEGIRWTDHRPVSGDPTSLVRVSGGTPERPVNLK